MARVWGVAVHTCGATFAARAYTRVRANLVVDVHAGGVVEFPHGAVCTGQNERET